jgi:hypothetical protein
MLACGLTSFNPHYPNGRGQTGNPLILHGLWAAGCIDKGPNDYYIVQDDTLERASKAAKTLYKKFWNSTAAKPEATMATIIKAFGSKPELRKDF